MRRILSILILLCALCLFVVSGQLSVAQTSTLLPQTKALPPDLPRNSAGLSPALKSNLIAFAATNQAPPPISYTNAIFCAAQSYPTNFSPREAVLLRSTDGVNFQFAHFAPLLATNTIYDVTTNPVVYYTWLCVIPDFAKFSNAPNSINH